MTGKELALNHWQEKRDKVPHFIDLAKKMVDSGDCYGIDCISDNCPFNGENYSFNHNLCIGNCQSYLKELKKLSGVNMKEKFIEFLKERGIYEKFVGCVYLGEETSLGKLLSGNAHNYITNAFSWAETEDGYIYWREVEEDWEKLLKEQPAKPFLTHNGIEWSEDTVKSILDKYSKEGK